MKLMLALMVIHITFQKINYIQKMLTTERDNRNDLRRKYYTG